MSKYVVKNCPCYVSIDSFKNTCASLYTCESDTDCLIKQTIELCICAKNELAQEILQKWEIEEIENAG